MTTQLRLMGTQPLIPANRRLTSRLIVQAVGSLWGTLFRKLLVGLVSLSVATCAALATEHREDRLHSESIELEMADMSCPVSLQSFATGTTPEGRHIFGELLCYDGVHKPTCLGVVWGLSGKIARPPTPVECQAYLTNIASETFVLEDHDLAMTVRAPDGEHAYLIER